jgi:hypothetical protein
VQVEHPLQLADRLRGVVAAQVDDDVAEPAVAGAGRDDEQRRGLLAARVATLLLSGGECRDQPTMLNVMLRTVGGGGT